ncbi:hypothetical protein ALC57_08393 [Trachymyrmex cornetzi]|uniref:Uncharacterized protein n=1 Tax=Trachymyrmex cornetzi TaxID=471704 RepID=A0A195E2B2_9HYME|nr:hypothetical protein ALC57_08393 [Trachymyrmex cornetzi]
MDLFRKQACFSWDIERKPLRIRGISFRSWFFPGSLIAPTDLYLSLRILLVPTGNSVSKRDERRRNPSTINATITSAIGVIGRVYQSALFDHNDCMLDTIERYRRDRNYIPQGLMGTTTVAVTTFVDVDRLVASARKVQKNQSPGDVMAVCPARVILRMGCAFGPSDLTKLSFR